MLVCSGSVGELTEEVGVCSGSVGELTEYVGV